MVTWNSKVHSNASRLRPGTAIDGIAWTMYRMEVAKKYAGNDSNVGHDLTKTNGRYDYSWYAMFCSISEAYAALLGVILHENGRGRLAMPDV